MKRLDKFILKAFIGPFVAVLLVVVFILVMQFLWVYIDELVGKGLGLKVIGEFLMWATFTILPLALPLATLLSSMMVMGQMTENNELMAIKASGVSLVRVMTPLTIVSVFVAVSAFFIGNNLVPKAFNEIYTLRDDIGRTKSEIKIPSGTFYDGIDGYVIRVEDQADDGMMHSVMVYDHTKKKGNISLTIADSATMSLSKAKDYLIFTLYHGVNYQEDNARRSGEYEHQLQRISFDRQQLIISLSNYAFEKSDDARYGNQIKAQKLHSLVNEHDSLGMVTQKAYAKHYAEIVDANYFTFKRQLDSSYFDSPKRNFHSDDYLTWKNRKAKISALEKARDKANYMASDMTNYSSENYVDHFYLRRTDVEILKRFAQALACFILFFIGAPLGALIGKGGLGVSAIISVLFFVLYWVIDISGTKLANDGAVPPFWGAFISSLFLFPIGMYWSWKAVHDSTFKTGGLKMQFRRIKSKISSLLHKTRIVYMGTPEFAVAPLDNLIKHGHKVVGVVTVADKPSGRGLKVNESAVKKYAVEHGIPVLQPLKLKDPEFLAQLKALKADLFVVVAFRMLPEEVWKMPRLGTFNLHAALLPQYRGAAPINWAVINGERITGVTTFMIDHNIDTGGIILRQECRISPTDDAGIVHDNLMKLGSDLVLQTVEGIIENSVETRVQRSFVQGSEVLKGAPKLTPELQNIDWRDSATQIYNLIRGLSPYPTAYTMLQKGEEPATSLKIFSSEVMECPENTEPGTVITDGKTYFAIAAQDGAISVKELQLSGKKRMKVEDFLRGFRDAEQWKALNGTSKAELERLRNK